jgi:hypothetical protein
MSCRPGRCGRAQPQTPIRHFPRTHHPVIDVRPFQASPPPAELVQAFHPPFQPRPSQPFHPMTLTVSPRERWDGEVARRPFACRAGWPPRGTPVAPATARGSSNWPSCHNIARRAHKVLREHGPAAAPRPDNPRARPNPMNQNPAPNALRIEINHAIRATRTAIQRYSTQSSDSSIRITTATRSKDSHLGIVIHRAAPACGRRASPPSPRYRSS